MKLVIALLSLMLFSACQEAGDGFANLEEQVETQQPQEQQQDVIGNSAISITPQSYDFGPAATLTDSVSHIINLENTSTKDLFIDDFFGFNDNFTVLSNNCPARDVVLTPGQSCQLSIEFFPQTVGSLSSTIVIKYGTEVGVPSFNSLLPLSGTGVGQLNFDGISEVTNIRHNSMRLNWETVAAATSFMVFQINGANMNYIDTVLNTGGTTTFYNIEGLTPNTAYTYRVRAVDALGNQDGNTNDVETTTAVNLPPVLDSISAPTLYSGELISNINASDANTNSDYDQDGDKITYTCRYDNFINGTVSSGSADCDTLINEEGSNPSFNAEKGIFSSWVPRTEDIDTDFEFEIIGTDTYGASSSTIFSGRVVPGTPDPPILTDITPAVPSNNNAPVITGTAMNNMQINLYSDAACTNLIGSGNADGSGNWSVSATVPNDQTIRIYADAENAIGNHSNCSSNFVNYTEDSTGPSTIMIGTTPATSTSLRDISVAGFTEAAASVEVFSDASCSTSLGTTSADGGGDFSVDITVSAGITSRVYARSTDAAGNTGTCSVTYAEYTHLNIADYIAHFVSDQTEDSSDIVNTDTAKKLSWNVTSEYDYNYFIHNKNSQSDEITIKQDGIYFFALTIPLVMTSGTYRPAVEAEILVNGTPMSGAHAESSYIRNGDNHLTSSLHIAILSPILNANDIVTITVKKTAGESGDEVVKLSSVASLFVEYKPNSLVLFSGESSATTNSADLNSTTAYPLIWNHLSKTIGVTHTDGDELITLDNSGDYLVFTNTPTFSSVNGRRTSINTQVQVEGSTITGGKAMQGYTRNDSSHDDASIHWSGLVANINAGENLSIATQREAYSGSVIIQAGKYANVSVEKVDTSSNYFSAFATRLTNGTNWGPNSAGAIQWTEMNNGIKDTTVFEHDTNTSSHEITLNQDGDYLVIFNCAYTSNVQRAAPSFKVLLNGSPVIGAESNTGYIRAIEGHDESSSSLVFLLRDVNSGQKVSLTAQNSAKSGTVNISDKAMITIIKK